VSGLYYTINDANVIELNDIKYILDEPGLMINFCRTAAQKSCTIGVKSWLDIYQHSRLIKFASPSYLRDELSEMIMVSKPSVGFIYLEELLLLDQIFPELAKCTRVPQSRRSGVKNVFEHTMFALDASISDLTVRLAVLFHDSGKPETLQCFPDGRTHFFKHEYVGADIAKKHLTRLQFNTDVVNDVCILIKCHMFDADPKITQSGVKRLIQRVGVSRIYRLLLLREADRQGTPNKISLRKIKNLRKKVDQEIGNLQ
jgi:tRNA nucleotidyltransferase (CCA-adding enzyme)